MTMCEPNSRLILIIEADSWEEARSLQEDYLYHGGREKLGPLDIPASDFQISTYPCGLREADIVEIIEEHPITDPEGREYQSFPKGSKFRIYPGDKAFPQIILARRIDDNGIGQFHSIRDFEAVRHCYRKLENSDDL